MTKYIHECRMGPAKSFKTGAVVGTYPKPMLVASLDEGGLDVIPRKGKESTKPDDIRFDCSYEDIVFIRSQPEFLTWLAKPASEQPKILAYDFADASTKSASLEFRAAGNSLPLQALINMLNAMATKPALPWQAFVLDPLTQLQDMILQHIAAAQPGALADARQWASMIGTKVQQICAVVNSLPCHTVVIAHSTLDKNELTGTVIELPNIYGKTRDSIGGLFSQFFYSTKKMGKAVLWTTDQGFVRGIGPRWPAGLPNEVSPDFKSIYGKEFGV